MLNEVLPLEQFVKEAHKILPLRFNVNQLTAASVTVEAVRVALGGNFFF